MHLLRALRKGQAAYTDKLKGAYLGFALELHQYTEHAVGNQVLLDDLARTMNEKATYLERRGRV